MLQPFNGLSIAMLERPLQPKVRPGMWYFEARRQGKATFDYIAVTLNQAVSDAINQSSDPQEVWLDEIIRQTKGGGWAAIRKNFQSITVFQWTEIEPVNKIQILAAASAGKPIREILRLNLILKIGEF